jgi:hypothetical protein
VIPSDLPDDEHCEVDRPFGKKRVSSVTNLFVSLRGGSCCVPNEQALCAHFPRVLSMIIVDERYLGVYFFCASSPRFTMVRWTTRVSKNMPRCTYPSLNITIFQTFGGFESGRVLETKCFPMTKQKKRFGPCGQPYRSNRERR